MGKRKKVDRTEIAQLGQKITVTVTYRDGNGEESLEWTPREVTLTRDLRKGSVTITFPNGQPLMPLFTHDARGTDVRYF